MKSLTKATVNAPPFPQSMQSYLQVHPIMTYASLVEIYFLTATKSKVILFRLLISF